jgi:histidyl-tRNA synthetase
MGLRASARECMQVERMKLCAELWAGGINAEFGYKRDQNFNKDIVAVAQKQGIPFVVVFGDSELAAGNVNIKDMTAETQDTVSRGDMCKYLREKLAGRENELF